MTHVLEKLASFIEDCSYERLPPDVIEVAKLGLLDYTACAIAGATAPISNDLIHYLAEREGIKTGKCVLFGTNQKRDLYSACIFNGSSSHCLDFDDVSWATIGHPSVSVAAACFAGAQEGRWDGRELIRSYVLSVEVMHQIARLTMPAVSENGWHTTLTYGVFGAAVAGSLFYKLDQAKTINALAIAASQASGIRANFGTKTKALHAGLSNREGFDCALLARSGITGSKTAIEGQDGFAQCFAHQPLMGEVNIGEFWDLRENGLVIKQYPCCSGSHPTNDVWDEFLKENPIKPEDVERIEAGVSLLGPKELSCHLPQNAIEAKFSIEFALAYRLLHGRLTLEAFKDEVVREEKMQDLMSRIKMGVDEDLAKLGFIGTAPVKLKVYLRNGEVIRLSNDLAKGNPEKPLAKEEIRQKFFDCCENKLGFTATKDLFEKLSSLEESSASEVSSMGLLP